MPRKLNRFSSLQQGTSSNQTTNRKGLRPLHSAVVVVLLLLLVVVLFLDGSSSSRQPGADGARQAASATQIPRLNDNLSLALPNNKAEAQAFSRLHASTYNFDELSRLRQEWAVSQGQLPASSSNNGLAASGTPKPTSTASDFSRSGLSLTPQPTNANSLKNGPILNAPPAPGSCGTTSIVTPDPFEPDNTLAAAKPIVPGAFPGAPTQTHTLTSVGTIDPTQGDEDWVSFQITDLTVFYTIETSNLQPNSTTAGQGIDTVIELWKVDTTAATTTLVTSNDNIGAAVDPVSPFRSRVIYSPQTGDTAPGVTFYARVYGALNVSCTGSYNLSVSTVTSSSQLTPTIPPTATITPTPASPTPDSCHDAYEYDDVASSAKELRVSNSSTPPFGGTPGLPDAPSPNNNVQLHYICPTGDIDWVYIDLVKGKPYSIFTAALSGGLDTLMVLFDMDDKGNLKPIYSNDDFPGMGLASRIDFIVPATPDTPNGEYKRYWVAIKDVTGKGATLLSYSLVLTSPGSNQYDCIDQYEPDGLQYLGKEILVNETQNHVLCPNGDADWVKFFAKAGRTYNLKTAFGPIPGMDTSMTVWSIGFDPNNPTQVISQNLLASNDDASPTDLSSAVSFSVNTDGYYYAQIKNNGDIGKTGFYYQLSFAVAGVSLTTPNIPATQTASAGLTLAATATIRAGQTATVAAARTATSTALGTPGPTFTSSSNSLSSALSYSFADPAFQKLWYYSDLAISQNQTQRSWEWGPKPGVVLREPYAETPGGMRQVQYFDKSRMEINNPKSDRTSQWFVTNGLLVKEMITGQIAMGENAFDQRNPANIQLAGDLTPSNKAPTYARLAPLITNGPNNQAPDLTGQVVKQELTSAGQVVAMTAPPELLKNAVYIKETGHNIPLVFYDYMNGTGDIYDDGYKQGPLRNWLFSMGYPLSEPYWVSAQVGGVEQLVLVQAFERRVLTYTPSNAPEWRVEMANVGQHYYLWRYNKSLYQN